MGQQMQWIGIGVLSKRTRVNVETIRYYERIGLIEPPPRTEGGHRVFGEDQVRALFFIKRCRELGFSLDEIRRLLRLAAGGATCGEVQTIALEHADRIRRKIGDLRRMERTLVETAARCKGADAPECPIIEALSRP